MATPPPPPASLPPPPMPKKPPTTNKSPPPRINFEEAVNKHKQKAEANKSLMPGAPVEKPVAPPPILVRKRTQEEVQQVLNFYGHMSHAKVKVIGPDDHLGAVCDLINNPKSTLLALDFDQTLTLVRHVSAYQSEMTLRGGDATKAALREAGECGVQIIVITGVQVVNNLVKELRHLGLDDLLHVEDWDRTPVYDLLKSWGENEGMSLERLRQKLAVLVSFNTPRFPVDLARIGGPSKTVLDIATSQAEYYLMQVQGNAAGDWSAKQMLGRIPGKEDDDALCPVLAWQVYLKRTEHLRKVLDDGKDDPERLFITHEGAVRAQSGEETTAMVKDALELAAVVSKYVAQMLEEVTTVVAEDGVHLARKYNAFASRYNKPQAVDLYLREHPEITNVFFVDDNSDNVWKMFEHFSVESREGQEVLCVWFMPPVGGRSESFDPALRENIHFLIDFYNGKTDLSMLDRAPDLTLLNEILATRSYLKGYTPTLSDAIEFLRIMEPPRKELIHVWRWYYHIASFPDLIRAAWPKFIDGDVEVSDAEEKGEKKD